MIKVGVTGGIGSGKSVVCKIFERLGIPIFNADQAAKELMQKDLQLKNDLIKLFGSDIYTSDKTLHRKKLASIIFNDHIALEKINKLVHPKVRRAFESWANKQQASYVIQEAALLFESKQTQYFDKIVTIAAPIQLRIDRVIKRDTIEKEKVLERINNQLSEEVKIEGSDYVIYNNDTQLIIPQVIDIHKQLLGI